MPKIQYVVFLISLLFFSGVTNAIESISNADYQRALSFLYEKRHNTTVFNAHIEPHWFADNSGLWYLDNSPKGSRYLTVSLPDLVKSDLFDHQKLADKLSSLLAIDVKPTKLPITELIYDGSGLISFKAEEQRFTLDLDTYALKRAKVEHETNVLESTSPDATWVAYSHHYNLFVKSAESGEIKQLSTAGKKGYEYASYYGWDDIIKGENGERPQRFSVSWSKDSQWIHANIVDLRAAQKMYLLDWSQEQRYRPQLLSYYRGSPGDENMVMMEAVFFNVASGKEVKLPLPITTHINQHHIEWSKTPGMVYIRSMTRGYQNLSIHRFDLNTEKLETIYQESSNTNIDNFTHELAEDHGLLFFLSDKSGWRQLYQIDLITKKERRITTGEYYINSIEKVDQGKQKVYFTAMGKEKGSNPYYKRLYSLSFDGSEPRLLSKESKNHQLSLSPNAEYFVTNISTINTRTLTSLRSTAEGENLLTLGKADVSMLANWRPPEEFSSLAGDGKTMLYGVLWKPSNFNKSKRYPIIEMSYTGPHTQVFPTEFARAFSLQSFAELGFVVVVIDGRGTGGRSKAFLNYSYKNLGKGLSDHIDVIKALGKKNPWMDTDRVGIFGHSAGGYDAGRAVLAYPDFYKVAVASAANHDHRMEKAWWPEMYMGWPVDDAYDLQSNISNAANLRGKLLLVHGGIDENVNPSATFKLAEALINADKQFDMLIMPSQRHGFQGQHLKYFTKTRWNYFIKHLRGVEPIWEIDWE